MQITSLFTKTIFSNDIRNKPDSIKIPCYEIYGKMEQFIWSAKNKKNYSVLDLEFYKQ